jgi:conjugal transfer ATP-binding protein TraC
MLSFNFLPIPALKKDPEKKLSLPIAQENGEGSKNPGNVQSLQNILAPKEMEIDFNHLQVDKKFLRTIFVAGYPRFVSPGWLDPIINFDHSLDLSFFVYPVEGKTVLDDLRRKIAEMEAEIATDLQRGRIVNPGTQAKLEDARDLQEQLVKGAERFFMFSFYITVHAESIEELNTITQQVQSTLGSLLIVAKPSSLQMEEGFLSTLPLGTDKLNVTRNMDTTSLATTFPFVSAELSSDRGVLYGINESNDSLVIFDRFKLENYNSLIFATSGAGKSYTVKLEAVRSLMLGAEIFIIDPEAEYGALAKAVGGEFISFSFNSPAKVNPFDLSGIVDPEENQLGLKILSLHSLFTVIMGQMNPTEQALLDRAFIATYKSKGITQDPATQTKQPPLMEDLYKVLQGMEDPIARSLADRLEKFVRGSFQGIFDQQTNINLSNPFTVFSVRDLEESLRPIAMFIILDFIWTRVKRDLKKRILIVDEAWHLMRYPDTAQFLYSVAKRARKYYLGLTTITQDVEDFLNQDIGKAIVTNSSLRVLLKQSPAAIEKVADVFKLSEGEKQLLLSADVGEGIFFAGSNHVAIRVVASEKEHALISTKPEDVLERRQRDQVIQAQGLLDSQKQTNAGIQNATAPAPAVTPQPSQPISPSPNPIQQPIPSTPSVSQPQPEQAAAPQTQTSGQNTARPQMMVEEV